MFTFKCTSCGLNTHLEAASAALCGLLYEAQFDSSRSSFMNSYDQCVPGGGWLYTYLCSLFGIIASAHKKEWEGTKRNEIVSSEALFYNAKACVTLEYNHHGAWGCFMALYLLLILRHCVERKLLTKISWIKILFFPSRVCM